MTSNPETRRATPAADVAARAGPLRRAARDAWLYVLPLIEMAATRAGALKPPGLDKPLPLNRFAHARRLMSASHRLVTGPNNDTMFSSAWADLTEGPLTLTIPPTGSRYISVALMNMYADNDAVLGTRTVGPNGGRFTVVGGQQAGGGPGVVRLSTPHGWVVVRMLVDGEADLPAVRAVQDQLRLEGPTPAQPPAYATRHANWSEYFVSAQQLLVANPPPATDTRILAEIAPLGLDAHGGFDPGRFDATATAEIEAGIRDARAALQSDMPMSIIDGWLYPPPNVGAFGQDYRFRAATALYGLAPLPPAEALYKRSLNYDGDEMLRLSFAPGQLPPVDAFWSISMYELTPEGQSFFTGNPIDRYSIGDRTPGLKTNANGSLDIWIARQDPGGERTANWLPAPARGPYRMTVRTYLPKPAIRDGRWRMPALQKV